MIRQKYRYVDGGPIKGKKKAPAIQPNIQTLDNIQFDSNTGFERDGYRVVTDITTKQPYSVIRNDDGSYKWHDGSSLIPKATLKPNQDERLNPMVKATAGAVYPQETALAAEVLDKLSAYSTNRLNGQMTPEELAYRQSLKRSMPLNYNLDAAGKNFQAGKAGDATGGRNVAAATVQSGDDLRDFYFGIDNPNLRLQKGVYTPSTGNLKGNTYGYRNRESMQRAVADAYMREDMIMDKVGKSKNNISKTVNFNPTLGDLGTATLGRGIDDRGEYISIYDDWNLEPLKPSNEKDHPVNKVLGALPVPDINNLMNPFEIYDRAYLSNMPQSTQDSIKMFDQRYGINPKDMRTNNKQKFNTGGDILSGISALSPLLNLIAPGVGSAVGGLAGMGAGMLNKNKMPQQAPTNYTNSAAFGFQSGGALSAIGPNAAEVTGAPGVVDGNDINYKGTPIKLNHGEILDKANDRVISKNNPQILKAYKEAELTTAKAQKVYDKTGDSSAKNTLDIVSKLKDALFQQQEQEQTLLGNRNEDGSTKQKNQEFNTGGNIFSIGSEHDLTENQIGKLKKMGYGVRYI
jgi:hypothetical protein